ncbi:MAG: alanine racemase [Oceanicoccus sp.]
MHNTTATISLNAIRHNLQQVKYLAPNAHVMAMVKADAYGHGLIEVAAILNAADGLAVARAEEALKLRAAGIEQRILILGGLLNPTDLKECCRHSIDIVIHNVSQANDFLTATLPTPMNIWLKIDSGMHRLGLSADEFQHYQQRLSCSPNTNEILGMTHFSSADADSSEQTQQQQTLFEQVVSGFSAPQSLANSAAIIKRPQSHRDWVRPGIMLYGANPLPADSQQLFPVNLHPAMTLSSKVLATRLVKSGDSVGYNARWTAPSDRIIATVGVGYGDGYPRHAPNDTPVLVNGRRAGLVGAVSMDLITIDVSNCGPVSVGDEVTLWGNASSGQQLLAEEVAQWAETISYELFTSVTARVAKSYTDVSR